MRIQVLGEVGARLNYDELVYNDDTIRPPYLVMYDIPCKGRRSYVLE